MAYKVVPSIPYLFTSCPSPLLQSLSLPVAACPPGCLLNTLGLRLADPSLLPAYSFLPDNHTFPPSSPSRWLSVTLGKFAWSGLFKMTYSPFPCTPYLFYLVLFSPLYHITHCLMWIVHLCLLPLEDKPHEDRNCVFSSLMYTKLLEEFRYAVYA